jgi:hypothetical protein
MSARRVTARFHSASGKKKRPLWAEVKKKEEAMTKEQAEKYAEMLDRTEAELTRIRTDLWSLRQALQHVVGKPVGYQYDEPR